MSIIPQPLNEFTAWVGLQLRKRPEYASSLGLAPDEIDRAATADLEALRLCQEAQDALAVSAAKVNARDNYLKAYSKATRADIARYKTNPRYTEALGKECMWLSSGDAVSRDALQSTCKIGFSPEGIRIDWAKQGQDGVEVFRRPAGSTKWVKLAFDTRSPYVDTEAGLTGPYEYYTQLMYADKPVGQASNIVMALHGGR